jgi:hypothetical protein
MKGQDCIHPYRNDFIERKRDEGILAPRGCMRDGGRSSGVDMQVKVPNRLKLLWSKVMVVSVEEKVPQDGIRYESRR